MPLTTQLNPACLMFADTDVNMGVRDLGLRVTIAGAVTDVR